VAAVAAAVCVRDDKAGQREEAERGVALSLSRSDYCIIIVVVALRFYKRTELHNKLLICSTKCVEGLS
jgi:hypothetical protein